MKTRAAITLVASLSCGLLLPGCAYITHVPPGQSLSVALAKKAELVALPAPTPQAQPVTVAEADLPADTLQVPPTAMTPVPETEEVADAYTLGNLCLQQGRYTDAIAAYEKAVQRDPSFADAWNKLALAYEDAGQDDKAMEAFKKYKMVSEH
jgi:tetratricopeptide (TPR) repeat protein